MVRKELNLDYIYEIVQTNAMMILPFYKYKIEKNDDNKFVCIEISNGEKIVEIYIYDNLHIEIHANYEKFIANIEDVSKFLKSIFDDMIINL